MGRVIGEKPRPRMLVLKFGEDEVVNDLKKLAPTVLVVNSRSLDQIRQAEWDLAVIKSEPPSLHKHIFIVIVGPSEAGSAVPIKKGEHTSVSFDQTSVATEFKLPDDLPSPARRLAEDDLLPLMQRNHVNRVMYAWVAGYGGYGKHDVKGVISPFLLDADGNILAGSFRRAGGEAETWCLPAGVSVAAWVAAAIEHWHALAPDRFPRRADWLQRPEWMTPGERAAVQAREEHEAELPAFLERHQQRAAQLAEAAAQAREAADAGPRRLLTHQGDDLADAVARALEDMGFRAERMDPQTAGKGAKLEDLRVYAPGWEALVEVRGYKGGASLNDLLRVGRFVTRFAAEMGRPPKATWYVVNQLLERDPDTRPQPLAANADEVATFAESAGLVIDTRDLFRLWNAVMAGGITAEAARALLMSAAGIFEYRQEQPPAPA